MTKPKLIQELQSRCISLNTYAEQLLGDDRFTVSETKYSVLTVELSVRDLGFTDGATTERIFAKAAELGLALCPLELTPHWRLQYLDQTEGHSEAEAQGHQAPSGSVTVASEPLSADDDFPKGFYLRRIDGVLWLRGYRADRLHVWNAHDRFVFMKE
ncbi:helicase [Saccharibacillus sp. CPCC 101409]|uniref:helicase n=1 Tax=Saccharibacillus sp. CPCC 101409 TaxID=3058041 RepID=UPI00267360CC|nr:helicase [Saccharibacillus sp. CPCC 101409]MDO3410587.1 helicase [Saccharibacillus sp. CPCC 101409]